MKKVAFFVNSLSGGGAEKILQTLLNRWNGNRWQVVVYSIRKEDIPAGYPRNVSVRFLFDALREEDGPWARLLVKIRNGLKLLVYRHFPPSVFYRLFIRGTYDVEAAFIEGYATRIAAGSPHAGSRKLAWVHIDLPPTTGRCRPTGTRKRKRPFTAVLTRWPASPGMSGTPCWSWWGLCGMRGWFTTPWTFRASGKRRGNPFRNVRKGPSCSALPAVSSARRALTGW